ncbi:MAG: hypothetical protein D6714_01705, partial [Bacteroidetes bacterium]
MVYELTKPLARIALSVYFRKIFISNRHRIPTDKPVLFAANHPSAFIEPCILAVFLPRPLHYMARGDFFLKSAFFKTIYKWYHIVPIFRLQDGGFAHLKDNFSAFDAATEILKNNQQLLVLAEGTTIHEKRLRPIKKGAARVAFGALEKYPDLDIQVVPVGVNYTNSDRFRSVAMIDFGAPFSARDFLETYRENENAGMQALTQTIADALAERVIHIRDPKADADYEKVLSFLEYAHVPPDPPTLETHSDFLFLQKAVTDRLNDLEPDRRQPVFDAVSAFEEKCKSLKINQLGY